MPPIGYLRTIGEPSRLLFSLRKTGRKIDTLVGTAVGTAFALSPTRDASRSRFA